MTITVKELIELLQGFDQSAIVVMAKDSEGNSYSPLEGAYDNTTYVPDSTWSGQTYITNLTPELEEQGFSDEDLYDDEDGVAAIVLHPVN